MIAFIPCSWSLSLTSCRSPNPSSIASANIRSSGIAGESANPADAAKLSRHGGAARRLRPVGHGVQPHAAFLPRQRPHLGDGRLVDRIVVALAVADENVVDADYEVVDDDDKKDKE